MFGTRSLRQVGLHLVGVLLAPGAPM
jgi:hypothetical protein